ncbi:MAG: hypothetical protein WAZ94_12745 [Phycisphaerales bacterium]
MRSAALLFCTAGLPLAVHAQSIPQVIYSKVGGHPTATIPGALDASGAPVTAEFRAMEDLIGSTDGTQWLLKGRTQLGSDLETMLMLGSGTTGSVLIQEGQPALGGGWYDFIGSGVGRFNTEGDFAFSARVRTGATGSTSAADGHRVHKSTSGVLSLAFKQLDPYTGLSDTNPSGDETVGNSVGSIHLLDEGTIGCQDSTINNIHTSRRPAIFYNRAMFHQTGVTTIVAMGGLGNRPWSTIDANEFFTTPDAAHWIAEGQVTLPTSGTVRVLVLDGNAVLQANELVPGSSLVLGDIFQSAISAGGHWISRGRDNSGTTSPAPDWLVLDGTRVAETGMPLITGSSETLGDTFSTLAVDNAGNYAYVANVAAGNPASDTALIYNGTHILAREGDPVDLNGNGLPDDNAFIGRGNNTLAAFVANNSLFLSADGHAYFLANLRDGDGNDLNTTSSPAFGTPNALIRVALPTDQPPCDPDLNQDGNVDQDDISYLINVVGGGENPTGIDPDFNHDGNVDQDDVSALINTVGGGGCP